jgi:hypothetical protein
MLSLRKKSEKDRLRKAATLAAKNRVEELKIAQFNMQQETLNTNKFNAQEADVARTSLLITSNVDKSILTELRNSDPRTSFQPWLLYKNLMSYVERKAKLNNERLGQEFMNLQMESDENAREYKNRVEDTSESLILSGTACPQETVRKRYCGHLAGGLKVHGENRLCITTEVTLEDDAKALEDLELALGFDKGGRPAKSKAAAEALKAPKGKQGAQGGPSAGSFSAGGGKGYSLAAMDTTGIEMPCCLCGQHGHKPKNCRGKPFCQYCEKPGHHIGNCRARAEDEAASNPGKSSSKPPYSPRPNQDKKKPHNKGKGKWKGKEVSFAKNSAMTARLTEGASDAPGDDYKGWGSYTSVDEKVMQSVANESGYQSALLSAMMEDHDPDETWGDDDDDDDDEEDEYEVVCIGNNDYNWGHMDMDTVDESAQDGTGTITNPAGTIDVPGTLIQAQAMMAITLALK